MVLSPVDKLILESYTVVLEGLGAYLGEGYEFALHSLESYDESVIQIIHGYHSNRQVGAPITNLALEMLKKIESQGKDKQYVTYFNRKESGAYIKSSTLPIIGENERIIGLLCCNFYTDTPLATIIKNLLPHQEQHPVTDEVFANSADDIITNALNIAKEQVNQNPAIASTNRNREIIALLFDQGIFKLKNAVVQVSNNLGISKNTVYLHLRSLEK